MSIEHLLRSIGYPVRGELTDSDPLESAQLYKLARRNKISSLYMSSLESQDAVDKLKEQYEERTTYQSDFQLTVARLPQLLPSEVEYGVVKTYHPFPADSSDIDIILYADNTESQIRTIKSYFSDEEYEVLGIAPTAITVRDKDTDILIDIQDDFGLHKATYFDKSTIRESISKRPFHGDYAYRPSHLADLALHIDHSLTELQFTLKEYYTTVYALETHTEAEMEEFVETVRQNSSNYGAAAFLTVVDTLTREVFGRRPENIGWLLDKYGEINTEKSQISGHDCQMPHRYSNTTLARYTIDRLKNKTFRKGVYKEFISALDPRVSFYLLSKVYDRATRSDYTRKHSSEYDS